MEVSGFPLQDVDRFLEVITSAIAPGRVPHIMQHAGLCLPAFLLVHLHALHGTACC